MADTTRKAAAEPLPPSKRSIAHKYTMDRIRYVPSTMMSHIKGEPRLEYTNSSQRRSGWPRSITTKPIASTVQQMEVHTAIFDTPPKPSMPNTRGALEMIRPPADRPTRNMNIVM